MLPEILRIILVCGGTWVTWRLLRHFSYKNPIDNLAGPVGESWWAGRQASWDKYAPS